MNDTMRLWPLGMGIPPEKVENDDRLKYELELKDDRGAWDRLWLMRYEVSFEPLPEFGTAAAQLEFMSIVSGRPTLWM